jgi:hypothetical protein
MAVKDYIRERFFPHIWCQGCGHGIVLNNLLRAVEKLGMSKNEIVMASGIGCSSRISGYVDFHTLHTIHGRALAFATGVKLSKPELNVIVPMGDGDALSIGGNHFIHAARRNIDITAIIMNNRIYGMTGGQYSPLSGEGTLATTAPYYNIDQDFDVVELATAAGGHLRGAHHRLPRAGDPEADPPGHPQYIDHTLPFLQKSGGEVIFMGKGGNYLIGPQKEVWDLVMLLRQKSLSDFMAFASNHEYLAGRKTYFC